MLKKMTMITKRQKRWTGRKDELGENLMLHHQSVIPYLDFEGAHYKWVATAVKSLSFI